jgi:predicted 3-demethylubiquinone-9 3-methyltransferase (glyoxalase superfamily)
MPITPCLWFNQNALEAAHFYASLFPNSRIIEQTPAAADYPSTQRGEILLVEVELDGQRLTLLNGGPHYTLTEAISLQFPCASQELADRYYDALMTDGGEASMRGWLKDRFGLSWQVYPQEMGAYIGGSDPEGAARAMAAMLTMQRIDLDVLRAALNGQ